MATLIKHRNQYLCKIQKWNGVKQIATHIPLRTNKKDTALVRHKIVEKSEQHIKDGIIKKHQFKGYFEWLNVSGTSKLSLLTLSDALDQFLTDYEVNVSVSSVKRMKITSNHIIRLWRANTSIKQINVEHIESFKSEFKDQHSPYGININLRNIKTFLRWCCDRNMIKTVPKIKMMREPKKLPKYISEENMRTILNANNLSIQMKRAFYLYLTTGCRRSEVIEGTLDKKMLIVPASLSKSRIERQISLNSIQAEIVKEIHIARDTHLLNGFLLEHFKARFGKAFVDACDNVGLSYTLHCLRHTYAVTQWIVSNDIYEVKNKLGHTSVTTTERYAQFNLDRLAQDFPSAYRIRLEVDKVRRNGINTPLINTPLEQIKESPV